MRASPEVRKPLRKKWYQYVRIGVSLILLAVGFVSLGYYGVELFNSRQHQVEQSRKFDEALKNVSPRKGAHNSSRQSEATIVTDVRTSPARPQSASPASDMPLGRIEVKSVGIEAMIEEGIAGKTLQQAVGHIPGTPLPGQPGNVGLAGHRDTFFRNLRNIHDDDEITLTTLEGTYRYRVALISIVEPNDMSVLAKSNASTLTLVTCYPFSYVGFAPKRFIVRAIMVESLPN
jgi:sortase A